jgi:uncharacterized surface protein with fasciclin (FAS1) repeats
MKKFKEQFNKFTKLTLSVLMVTTLLFVSSCGDDKSAEAEAWDEILYEVDDTDYFSTLKAAIDAAGLRETLSGEGPFTLFAPTNDAFAELDADVLAYLLATPEELTKVLNYHLVSGIILAGDLTNGELTTLNNGEKVTVDLSNGGIMINNANVIASSVELSNGVIHTINKVLIPENLDLSGMDP